MRTPVILVAGQSGVDAVADDLTVAPGTLAVSYRFDGQVVLRTQTYRRAERRVVTEAPLELVRRSVSCTVRDDLLVLLRRSHRRDDVTRIVVAAAPWDESEPIREAIETVTVQLGPGWVDGPAARDVEVVGVVACLDTDTWLAQALGDDELDDGRTVAQVVVGQAADADVVVAPDLDPATRAVLRRLVPRAPLLGEGGDGGALEAALAAASVRPTTVDRRHAALLADAPPLHAESGVSLVEFAAAQPFHPQRLHAAVDVLLDGVVRAHGRLWVAGHGDDVMWLESAGTAMRVETAGR